MRRTAVWRPGAAFALALLCAPSAGAIPRPVEVALRVRLGMLEFTLPALTDAEISTDGAHLVGLTLPEGVLATSGLVFPSTDPAAFPIRGIQVTAANGPGTFAQTTAGRLTGVMPIRGTARLCLFEPCASAAANVSVPLSVVGAGGTAAGTGPVQLTLRGAPWTTGTAALVPGYLSTHGTRHGPASATSTTARCCGSLLLVTPIVVSSNIGVGVTVPAFGFLSVRLVPEPAAALLGVASAGALAAAGAARRRTSRRA